jgi:hypothetical protein
LAIDLGLGLTKAKANVSEVQYPILNYKSAQIRLTLHDNIEQRFPVTQFMQVLSALNKAKWPSHPLQRALFGKTEIAYLCKEFNIENTKGTNCAKFLAACERGFCQINLHHTSLRNRLAVERVSDLLMVSINGPPLSHWNARKYVISWLKSGKRGALDKGTGLAKVIPEIRHSVQLFF